MATNKWFVRFIGTGNGRWITAQTVVTAKSEFARLANVNMSSRIIAHRKKPTDCIEYMEPAICSTRFARGEPYECEV